MERWTSLSPRLGNEASTFKFTADFFTWWRRKLIVIEDFPYARSGFSGQCRLSAPRGH
jgi:hypothetical protein